MVVGTSRCSSLRVGGGTGERIHVNRSAGNQRWVTGDGGQEREIVVVGSASTNRANGPLLGGLIRKVEIEGGRGQRRGGYIPF